MPKQVKELSAIEIKRLSKPGQHAVGGVSGLLHRITETGARGWVLRIKVGTKRRNIGLGGYPTVSLAQAREKAREMLRVVQEGRDPVAERQAAAEALLAEQKRKLTFEQAARKCHAARELEFRNSKHRNDWIRSLELYVFEEIGAISVADIDLPHIVNVLNPIWTTKTETATRVRQRIESVLAWAKVSGFRNGDNPARWDGHLSQVLPKPSKIRKVKHQRALPWQEVPEFMKSLRRREGMGARALEFLILTAARSGEVRMARWQEIDQDARIWTVPAERMKNGKVHRVPLSEDALRLLNQLPRLKEADFIFAAPRGGVLSDVSISAVCKRMEVDAVPHGFRSSFKDWARSCSSFSDEVSELALAHVNNDATRAAYARDELLPQRARQLEDWACFIQKGARGATIVPFDGKGRHQNNN